MPEAIVITVSDSRHLGTRVDRSGPAVAEALAAAGFRVAAQVTVPDEQQVIEDALRNGARTADLVVTTGGTGIALRDVTPEATRAVCERLIDGIPELMRAAGREETIFAALSRALCGTLGKSLILNLPGSPRGAVTSLKAVLPLVSHALVLLKGEEAPHPETESQSEESKRPF
jgi:molybdenum cofactor synthesis domain-containing protein